MTNLHLTIRIFLVFVVFLFLSCKPKIHTFSANPNIICEGETTTLSWEVTGSTLLYSQPNISNLGPVPSTGTKQFQLDSPTIFTIFAFKNSYRAEKGEQEVFVYSSEDNKDLVLRTEPSSTGGLVATVKNPWGDISDFMVIDIITNKSDRILSVKHEEVIVDLPKNGSSNAMHGLRISGSWEMHADLIPGEVIGDPQYAPPDRLRLEVKLICKR